MVVGLMSGEPLPLPPNSLILDVRNGAPPLPPLDEETVWDEEADDEATGEGLPPPPHLGYFERIRRFAALAAPPAGCKGGFSPPTP